MHVLHEELEPLREAEGRKSATGTRRRRGILPPTNNQSEYSKDLMIATKLVSRT